MSLVSAIQMSSSHDVQKNLTLAEQLIARAAKQGSKLLVLPENFALMGKTPADKIKIKETLGNGPIQTFLSDQAKKHHIWIVGGTIPLTSKHKNKVYAACLVYNDKGKLVAHYNKMHLFDVVISKDESYQESQTIQPGNTIVVVDTPIGKLGLAVCYDIRFPELFRCLFNQGAEIIALPAAFTVKTGKAHWELLARARAVENFSYVIGAAQTGTHSNGRKTYGHSLIVDPWGKVIASLPKKSGVISAEIDLKYLHKIRQDIPVGKHQKLFKNAHLYQKK